MSLFETHDEDSIYLSMHDADEPLSRAFLASFHLDDFEWPSVEHYYQAMKFEIEDYRLTIRSTATPNDAIKFAKHWLRQFKVRKDWKKIKTTIMTRAVYIQCRSHSNIADKLMAVANTKIVENSQYDYFWGCGRDKRGDNNYGKVLMDVRNKLIEERSNNE